MRFIAAIAPLFLLFCTAFASGRTIPPVLEPTDTLTSLYLYTEGIKQELIRQDTAAARRFFEEAIRRDTAYAPAYYKLAENLMDKDAVRAIKLASKAYRLDTTDKWYLQTYGQMLIVGERYDQALPVYRTMRQLDPQDPDNYRLLAALYEQAEQPFSAIATLDSAEVRFGRIPQLSATKRRLLVQTRQFDKAVEEARALAESVPYDAENHVRLGELYGLMGKDSLAKVAYNRAMQIDSTDIATLMSLADYYNSKQDYRSLLTVTKQIFASDDIPATNKVERFGQFTSDMRFYREYYIQLNELASLLAIKYPHDQQIVKLYADHLIASGELNRALEHYKLHTQDTPPVEAYFQAVVDIETYLQRPDSVERYVTRAIELFPDNPGLHIARANALSYAKKYQEALKAYKNSLRYAATDSLRSIIWGSIGDNWHQVAEQQPKKAKSAMKECYKAYEKALAYDRNNTMVLNNYAYFLSEEGRDLERALDMSGRVVALTDNNPTYLDTHAWVLYQLGRFAEAKKIQQQAIALDRRNSPELQVHYGDILAALGEKFMAEVYWRKALENGYNADTITHRIEKLKAQ